MYSFFTFPVNCSDPTPPANGAIDAYQNTTEGAVIMFICNSGFFVNLAVMEAVCEPDGRWNPDPATAAVCLRKCTHSIGNECLIHHE